MLHMPTTAQLPPLECRHRSYQPPCTPTCACCICTTRATCAFNVHRCYSASLCTSTSHTMISTPLHMRCPHATPRTITNHTPPINARPQFTVDEETGMTGAFQLDGSMLTGRTLLNLDSEDWGHVFVGCAGGGDPKIRVLVETRG